MPGGEDAQHRGQAGNAGLPIAAEGHSPRRSGGMRGRLEDVLQHSVFRNASMLFAVSMLNYVMPLILIPYLARALGVEFFGVYAFGMSIYLIGMVLIDCGFQYHGLYEIAEHRADPDRVGALLGAMLAIKLGLFLLLMVILSIYVYFNEQFAHHHLFLMLNALPVLGGALQFRWVFQAVEQSGKIVRYLVIGRLVQVALVFLFVSGPQDYLWVPIFHGVSALLSGVICIRMIHQLGYRFCFPTLALIREQIRSTSSYFFASVASAQLGFAGIFSLSHVVTPAVLGVYAVAEQLYRALRSLCHPLIDALIPFMKRSNDMKVFRRLCVVVFSVTAVGIGVGMVLSPYIIHFLFSAKYDEATPILRIFLPGLMAFVPAMMIGYPLLASMGHGSKVSQIGVLAAVTATSILGILWHFDALTGMTVAMTVLTSEILIFLGTMLLLWRVRVAVRLTSAAGTGR